MFSKTEGVSFISFKVHSGLPQSVSKSLGIQKSSKKIGDFDYTKITNKKKSAMNAAVKQQQSFASANKKKGKKIYEISRFFVKNYVGALKSTINNPMCEDDIMDYLDCERDHLATIKTELDQLLRENPKHNRMQLYKLITNPVLNPIFQYFLRRKVYSWIFTSSKMQDRQAHLMARKNFLYLCLKAKELTPHNFRIALNFK